MNFKENKLSFEFEAETDLMFFNNQLASKSYLSSKTGGYISAASSSLVITGEGARVNSSI